MRGCAYVVLTAAALGAAAVVVAASMQRRRELAAEGIPELLDDCRTRIERLSDDLRGAGYGSSARG